MSAPRTNAADDAFEWPPPETSDVTVVNAPEHTRPMFASIAPAALDRAAKTEPASTTHRVPPAAQSVIPRVVIGLVGIAIVQAVLIGWLMVRDRPGASTTPSASATAAGAGSQQAFTPPDRSPGSTTGVLGTPAETALAASPTRLTVSTQPAGAMVTIDGSRRGTTPATLDLSPGSHLVRIDSGGRSIDQTVTLEAGMTTSLIVPIPSSRGGDAGWVDVGASIPLDISEAGRPIGRTTDGPLRLSLGRHRLTLTNDAFGYSGEAEVNISADEMARVRPVLPKGQLQVNAQPWASVFIDGLPVGDTPLGNLRVAIGAHEVRFRHPELGEQVRQVTVTARDAARLTVDLRR
jgi:hypothetical protein